MSHWNYRLTVQTFGPVPEVWNIRELYYDEEGKVSSWTDEPCYPQGDTRDELASDFEFMREAFLHPVFDLDAEEFRA